MVEVKTTESNRFVTGFFQKYKQKETIHPDIWVLCQLGEDTDRFFVLTHAEMAEAQAIRNGFTSEFDWNEVHKKCAKGVDNVLLKHIEQYEGAWEKISKRA